MKLSVIVPCYNCKSYIGESLRFIAQKKESNDFEVILVDDGSTDGSGDLLKGLVSEFPFCRYVHQENSGVAVARNKGIEVSRGQWIAFLDSDDFTNIQELLKMAKFGNAHQLEVVLSNYFVFKGKPRFEIKNGEFIILSLEEFAKDSLINESLPMALWTGVYLRKFLIENKVKFTAEITFAEDQLFLIQALRLIGSIGFNKSIVYWYRVGHESLSGQATERKLFSLFKVLKVLENDDSYLVNSFISRRVKVWTFNALIGNFQSTRYREYFPISEDLKYLDYYQHMSKHVSQKRVWLNLFLLVYFRIFKC